MKKAIAALAVMLGWTLAASAQTTNVTATVTDSQGVSWSNAPYTVNIVSSIPPVTNPGNAPFTTSFSGTTNGSGVLSVTLQRVANIYPAGSTWNFCVTPAVTGPQTYCVQIPIGNSGQSSQDVSSQINAVIQPPQVGNGQTGYADSEASAIGGSWYFNRVSNTFRCFTTAWGPCGGSGLSSFSSPSNTITIGGTLTAPTVDLNLGASNTWSAAQTINFNGTSLLLENAASPQDQIQFATPTGAATAFMRINNNGGAADVNLGTGSAFTCADINMGSTGGQHPVLSMPGGASTTCGISDAAASDTVLQAPSGNTVRIGINGNSSTLRVTSTNVLIPGQKSTTGTRYVCIDTSGNLVSSATACSGT